MKQQNWWLDEALIERLREYQHENRIQNTTEAARRLLEDALGRWEAEQAARAPERRRS